MMWAFNLVPLGISKGMKPSFILFIRARLLSGAPGLSYFSGFSFGGLLAFVGGFLGASSSSLCGGLESSDSSSSSGLKSSSFLAFLRYAGFFTGFFGGDLFLGLGFSSSSSSSRDTSSSSSSMSNSSSGQKSSSTYAARLPETGACLCLRGLGDSRPKSSADLFSAISGS